VNLERASTMVSGQNPSKDTRRQQLRDDRLWSRELQRARLLNLKQLHCPCRKCKGQRRLQLQTVRNHLVQNGRDSEFQVWRGPRERHSSDEEWEEEFWTPEQQPQETLDAHIDMRGMIHNTFEEVMNATHDTLESRRWWRTHSRWRIASTMSVGPLTTRMNHALIISWKTRCLAMWMTQRKTATYSLTLMAWKKL
jgi:hypothetical protein